MLKTPCARRIVLPVLAVLLAGAPGPARAQSLSRITVGPPVDTARSSRSVNWVDADGDGDLDLYVTSGGSLYELNEYYRNDGGAFAAITSGAIVEDSLRADGSAWGDYDNDGDPDLFVVSWYNELNALFENLGGGAFHRVTEGPHVTTPTRSEGCAWADYDQDGDLDLYVANSGTGDSRLNLLYRNEGGGTFVAITTGPEVEDLTVSRQASWADYDQDGDVDLLVTNETVHTNRLYQNQLVETGSPDFLSVDAGPLTSDNAMSWSASWGDYDNDGDLDVVVANNRGVANFLYRNELAETGSATFAAVLDEDPVTDPGWSAGTQWADWDNDGDLDLLITNGWSATPYVRQVNCFYRNDGGHLHRSFESAAAADSAWSYGASWGDWDGDGDLDLFIANWFGTGESNYLYRNEASANGNHWLTVQCEGTESNRSGIGARIELETVIGGSPVTQLRQITGSDGYCSHNLRAHFGLGDASVADTVRVFWPSGTVQTLLDVSADRLLTIIEASTSSVPGPGGQPMESAGAGTGAGELVHLAHPNPFRDSTLITYRLARSASVRVGIYDPAGRRVRDFDAGVQAVGAHTIRWDAPLVAGAGTAAGVYYYRIELDGRGGAEGKLVLAP